MGIQITQIAHGLTLSQSKYASDVLQQFHMENSKATRTLSCPSIQLVPNAGVILPDPTQYWSMVGALQYLTFTCPNIAFSVHQLC